MQLLVVQNTLHSAFSHIVDSNNLLIMLYFFSDFAVVIAIVSMTIMDMMVGVDTPKLS